MISDIESNGHLSLTADSEIMWDKLLATFGDIGDYWLIIQESRLGGPTAKI